MPYITKTITLDLWIDEEHMQALEAVVATRKAALEQGGHAISWTLTEELHRIIREHAYELAYSAKRNAEHAAFLKQQESAPMQPWEKEPIPAWLSALDSQ